MFFRFTALMRRVRRFCASDCGAGKCWRSSAAFPAVWSGWKRVRRRTTGRASWARSNQQSDSRMLNFLKPIDLTDRAIRRAVFAVLDGLAAEHRAATTACRSVALPALSVGQFDPEQRNDDAGYGLF